MADTIIQIKRTNSGTLPTANNPVVPVEQGELVYIYDTGNNSAGAGNNGKRLYVGHPTNSNNAPIKIGGEYYTNLMEHALGTLTADAAILVDSYKKIDNLKVDNLDFDGNSIISTDTNGNINITPNGTGSVVIDGLNYPQADGSINQVLKTDGNGNLSFATVSGTLDIAADGGTDNGVVLGTDTLTISGGTGITTSVSGDVITVNGDIASTSAVGVASFATADFGVTVGGEVSLNDAVVKSITTDTGGMTPSTHAFSILGGEGIDVTHSGTTISVIGEDASDTNKGVASFASADFSVASGAVTIKTGGVSNTQLANSSITFGSTAVSLGDVVSSLSDVTTISTTSGDLTLNPTGNVDVNNNRISNVATPVDSADAVNKEYVDAVAEGLHIHASVEVATTDTLANLSGGTVTYSNGTNGVGATLSLGTSIAVSTGIDGFTDSAHLVDGARILIKNESTAAHNGIYTMTVTAGNITGFTRAADFNTAVEMAGGDFTFVLHGTNYANTGWVQTEHVDTVGTSDVSFTQFSGAGTYIAGGGLTLTGSTFDVVGTANRITVNANDIDIASTYVGQTSITTLGTIGTGTWNGTTIGVAYGGTGSTSLTANGIIYGNGTNAVGVTAAGTNGYILYSNNGTPDWLSAIDLITHVTGTLPVANGGTGATTLTSNGILYGNGTGAVNATAAGTDGYFLYSNNGTPAWTDTVDGGTY